MNENNIKSIIVKYIYIYLIKSYRLLFFQFWKIMKHDIISLYVKTWYVT